MDAAASVYRLAASLSPGTDMSVSAVLGTEEGEGILSLEGNPASARKRLGWKVKEVSGRRFRLEDGTAVVVEPAGMDSHKKMPLWALKQDRP